MDCLIIQAAFTSMPTPISLVVELYAINCAILTARRFK